MKLLAGNSNRPLAESVAKHLGIPLVQATIQRYADQEAYIEVHENVRGEDVFVLQSTSNPTNDHLMELLVMIDALRRGSARRITAVIPYYGYARQDRKTGPRSPISAKLVANLITVAGADRVLTFDLHSGQIQGFFDIPTDNLYMAPIFSRDIMDRFPEGNVVVVSPDVGGVVRARVVMGCIKSDLAIIDKRRSGPGKSEVMHLIGDVQGRPCVIVDDIIDSGGTICNAAKALMDAGAKSVDAYISHGVLSGQAMQRIDKSDLNQLVISDTIYQGEGFYASEKSRELTVAPLLAEALSRISQEQSVSSLFRWGLDNNKQEKVA